MNEQDLRGLVRQAVALHLAQRAQTTGARAAAPPMARAPHVSHGLFMLPADPAGVCLIEPAADCNHCGFCKSYGH